ncbi:MAG: hypothetical protein ACO2ON_01000 [Candidatus Nanopusillus sp.]
MEKEKQPEFFTVSLLMWFFILVFIFISLLVIVVHILAYGFAAFYNPLIVILIAMFYGATFAGIVFSSKGEEIYEKYDKKQIGKFCNKKCFIFLIYPIILAASYFYLIEVLKIEYLTNLFVIATAIGVFFVIYLAVIDFAVATIYGLKEANIDLKIDEYCKECNFARLFLHLFTALLWIIAVILVVPYSVSLLLDLSYDTTHKINTDINNKIYTSLEILAKKFNLNLTLEEITLNNTNISYQKTIISTFYGEMSPEEIKRLIETGITFILLPLPLWGVYYLVNRKNNDDR